MDKQSPFGKNDIIALMNIDDEPFRFEYNRAEGNPPYTINSGEVWRGPGWLAAHALKHLIDKVMTKREIRTSNVVERKKLAEEIVVAVEPLRKEREPSEAEKLQEEIQKLNNPSDLDLVLEGIRQSGKKVSKKTAKKTTKKAKPASKSAEVKAKPTKKQLLDYAENSLKMTMDEKTVKKLKLMKIDDLITELDYPIE